MGLLKNLFSKKSETPDLDSMLEPFDFDSKGWTIDSQELITPKRGVHPHIYVHDKLFESPDKKYCCLFYTITEYRMGSSSGLITIYKDKNTPQLLTNPSDVWFDYQGNDSFYFHNDNLFVRMLAYNVDTNLSGTPFVLFDLEKKVVGFIDFDWSSCYYSIEHVKNTIFKFSLSSPNEIKNSDVLIRDGEHFDVSEIKYYSFSQANNLKELYLEEKKSKC